MKLIQLLALSVLLTVCLQAKVERTFAMIKPHAVKEGKADEIMRMIKHAGFSIIASKKVMLTEKIMAQLYKEYTLRLWFRKYIKSMSHRAAIVMILEKNNAVKEWDLCKRMIRKHYGFFTNKNGVHGSDTLVDAKREIAIFFPEEQK